MKGRRMTTVVCFAHKIGFYLLSVSRVICVKSILINCYTIVAP